MKIITYLLLSCFAFSAWAKPMTHHEFVKLSLKQKVQVLQAYKDFLNSYTDLELESNFKTTQFRLPSLIEEAFASAGVDFECLYGGWPSVRVNGKCTHPKRGNPFYSQGTCSSNELQCQPMVYGEGFCADLSTQKKRNNAFRQCEEKFAKSGKTIEDVAQRLDLRSTEVNELFSTVKNVCEEKRNAGICRGLEEKIESIRSTTVAPPSSPETSSTQETDPSVRPEAEVEVKTPAPETSHNHHHDHSHAEANSEKFELSPKETEQILRKTVETAGRLNDVVSSAGQQVCQEDTHDHSPRDLRAYENDKHASNWSVNMKGFMSAACKSRRPPTDAAMDAFFQNLPGNDKQSLINGVSFNQENPELLQAFSELVQPQFGPSQDIQGKFSINPSCDKVLCAVQKIWGADLGKKLLYMKIKHGFNGSELSFKMSNFRKNPDGSAFVEGLYPYLKPRLENVNHILMTLEDLPPHDVPIAFNKNQPLGAVDSSVPNYGGAMADSAITLWPSWQAGWKQISSEHDSFVKQASLMHELGHIRGFKSPNGHDSEEWKRLASSCQTSTYGSSNNVEDFAESYVGYRYNGKSFQQRCPEKYAFMKDKIFGGIEYLDEETCHQDPVVGQHLSSQEIRRNPSADKGPPQKPKKSIIRKARSFFEKIFD